MFVLSKKFSCFLLEFLVIGSIFRSMINFNYYCVWYKIWIKIFFACLITLVPFVGKAILSPVSCCHAFRVILEGEECQGDGIDLDFEGQSLGKLFLCSLSEQGQGLHERRAIQPVWAHHLGGSIFCFTCDKYSRLCLKRVRHGALG